MHRFRWAGGEVECMFARGVGGGALPIGRLYFGFIGRLSCWEICIVIVSYVVFDLEVDFVDVFIWMLKKNDKIIGQLVLIRSNCT